MSKVRANVGQYFLTTFSSWGRPAERQPDKIVRIGGLRKSRRLLSQQYRFPPATLLVHRMTHASLYHLRQPARLVGVVLGCLSLATFSSVLSAESSQKSIEQSSHRAFEVGQIDIPPTPLKPIVIHLPRSLRKEHAEVKLRFIVTKEGKVSDLTVVKFSDSEMIDPVYGAYASAVYSPGAKDGKSVDVWVDVTEVAK